MELVIFARFHASAGQEDAVAAALREQVPAAQAEPGCLAIAAYRSTRDPRLFWIYSRWIDEAAFETHAGTAAHPTLRGTRATADRSSLRGDAHPRNHLGVRSLVLDTFCVQPLPP